MMSRVFLVLITYFAVFCFVLFFFSILKFRYSTGSFFMYMSFNPLMPGGNKKVTHAESCRFV